MNWYAQQCDGEWEHEFGVKIESQDNPGWGVYVDLGEASALAKPFPDISITRSDLNWLHCTLKSGTISGSPEIEYVHFVGFGGPGNLDELLQIALDYINAAAHSQ